MQSAQQLVMHDTLVLLCGTMLVAGAASCGGSDGSTGGTTTSPNGKSVSSVSISPPSASMAVGTTVTFAVTVAANGGASTAVTWVTSNSSVATVAPSGDATAVVTAVGPGTATISAISSFDATKQGTAAITVVAGVRSVNITPATLTLQKGRTAKFSATVSADAGVVTGVTWTSSNTGVATIGTDGTLTAVGNGTATITAKSTADASKTATAAITIIDPCSGTTNLTIPSTVNPALSTTSCFASNTYNDIYAYNVASSGLLLSMSVTSSAFPISLTPVIPAGSATSAVTGTGTVQTYALLKAGSYTAQVATTDSTKLGAYTLASSFISSIPSGCNDIRTTLDVSGNFVLSTGSCSYKPASSSGSFFAQAFFMNMPVGHALTVHVTSQSFSPLVEIRDKNNTLLASSADQNGSSTVTVSFTPTSAASLPVIYVTSQFAGVTGPFSITIDP